MWQDILPDEVKQKLGVLRTQHGPAALSRIDRFLEGIRRDQRHPLQSGCKHVLPGLTAKPWHDVRDYPSLREAVQALETHHPVITEEFLARLKAPDALVHYGHKEQIKGWEALYLYENGEPVAANVQHFPQTVRCLEDHVVPQLFRLAEVHFSLMEPGTHILPHWDSHNFTLSFHLALKIPEACVLRIGTEERGWHEGKCLLFDHSFRHEAWNKSSERRAVLIMDIWNPETTDVEREALGLVFKWLFDRVRA